MVQTPRKKRSKRPLVSGLKGKNQIGRRWNRSPTKRIFRRFALSPVQRHRKGIIHDALGGNGFTNRRTPSQVRKKKREKIQIKRLRKKTCTGLFTPLPREHWLELCNLNPRGKGCKRGRGGEFPLGWLNNRGQEAPTGDQKKNGRRREIVW